MPSPFLAPGYSRSKRCKERRYIRAFSTPSPGGIGIGQKEKSIKSAESFLQTAGVGQGISLPSLGQKDPEKVPDPLHVSDH